MPYHYSPITKKLEPCHSSVRGCRYGTVYEQESDYKSLKSQLQDTIQQILRGGTPVV